MSKRWFKFLAQLIHNVYIICMKSTGENVVYFEIFLSGYSAVNRRRCIILIAA